MTHKGLKPLALLVLTAPVFAACVPTVRVEVAPISIYAKLDHDVRISLDEDAKALVQQNPNLF
ncbi:YnbE family lipoprotein [Asticcacaulis sp. ZE23SCel15]|jgi:hypothetical protein|uniref:YnbE family lipoprotein n=1 Tax=Asticcacaulis sp. ZE23SCel15 TaxID=3059027 RepID=UPI00265DA24D|nr:YnbE family lipoprotein [Asticcacaulis sp. ZE23SCel15]WKL57753.1 YnbE family lipoprotein [Asticcacaulis sp. ZE23SCel15]